MSPPAPASSGRDGDTARISVVIAARNAADTLGAAVASTLSQPQLLECLVVDDASSDGTAAVARRLADGDARVAVLERQDRGGPAIARNQGLAHARGTRVCFLDADDQLADGGLAALELGLAATPSAVVALGRFRARDAATDEPADVGRWDAEQLRPVVRRHGRLIESPEGMTGEALVTRLVSPPPGAWLVDVATARAVGGFDPAARRSEDLELLVRLAGCGDVATVDRVVLHYARHDAQRSAARSRRRFGRGYTLWLVLRAAPGARATLRFAGGIAAYHLALFESRSASRELRVRAMGVTNLLVAQLARVAGLVAAVLPRRLLPPIEPASAVVVD